MDNGDRMLTRNRIIRHETILKYIYLLLFTTYSIIFLYAAASKSMYLSMFMLVFILLTFYLFIRINDSIERVIGMSEREFRQYAKYYSFW